MANPKQYMVHTLSDSSKVTAVDVANRVGCDLSTARCRLNRSKDVKIVYRPLQIKGTCKIYTLDDGSKWTLVQVADKTGLSKNAAGVRLNKTRNASYVLKPKAVKDKTKDNTRVSEAIKQSMYFDPLGHWKLLNKCL